MAELKTALISFASYNVLSPNLAKPSHHNLCKPEHLDNEARWEKLLAKMEAEVENSSIICLQEVNEGWADRLTLFFTNNSYVCRFRGYGSDFNGYMGVLVAFPLEKYELVDVATKRISDTVYWPEDDRHEKFNGRDYSDKTLRSLANAQRRWNATVWMKLREKESQKLFCVATYHMPCMFKDPKVMDVHAGLLVRFVQEKSLGLPTILSGDFNTEPDGSTYQLITTGRPTSLVASMFHNHKDGRKVSFGDDIRDRRNAERKNNKKGGGKGKNKNKKGKPARDLPGRSSGAGTFTNIAPMESAYKAFRKEEPLFTNYSKKAYEGSKLYADAIDYIFITEEFEVAEVLELYGSIDDIKDESLPNEKEMSDHLMLRATLKL